MILLGKIVPDELGNELLKQQANGKFLTVVNDTVIATDRVLTEKEKAELRINELLGLLKSYDYIGTKIATGRGTIQEYASQIKQMTEWANEINKLEAEYAIDSE